MESGLFSLPYPDSTEAAYRDVLAHRGLSRVDERGDGLRLVLDPLLVEQDGVLEEGLELAPDDLVDDLLRFPGVLGLLGVDCRLLFDGRLRHLFARDPRRVGKRDMHRDVL